MPWGTAWNTSGNDAQGKSFGRWAVELPGITAATTIEISYANANGRAVTAAILGVRHEGAPDHFLAVETYPDAMALPSSTQTAIVRTGSPPSIQEEPRKPEKG